jgi:hypothetical protein
MQIQNFAAQSQYLTLQNLTSIGRHSGEEKQENPVSTLTTRTDQVSLSAWSISISRQTTALINTNGDLSLSAGSAEEQQSPQEQIDEMAELVGRLKDEGKISGRRARHLEKVLHLAEKALDHGRALPAARLVRNFARAVDKLAGRGRMSKDAAAELIGSARDVVAQLREDACGSRCGDVSSRAGVMLMVSEFRLTVTQVSITQQSSETVTDQ